METIEWEVHQMFGRGAGLVVAGLISVVMQTQEFARTAEATRQGYSLPLAKGRNQKMAMRLLGGVMRWITSLYCEPLRRKNVDEQEEVSGLHVEQVQFGFAKKVSPGLESQVSRTVKYEDIYPKDYETVDEFYRGLTSYFSFYGRERPHQCLKYRTPWEVYHQPA